MNQDRKIQTSHALIYSRSSTTQTKKYKKIKALSWNATLKTKVNLLQAKI